MIRCLVLIVVALLGASTSACAAVGNLRIGTFVGIWCAYPARFAIESQVGDTSVFEGRITMITLGETDELRFEQNADYSLTVTRYLDGSLAGLTQVVRTSPPRQVYVDGTLISHFDAVASSGVGCRDGAPGYIGVPE